MNRRPGSPGVMLAAPIIAARLRSSRVTQKSAKLAEDIRLRARQASRGWSARR